MMEGATYSYVFDGQAFELPIARGDDHRRELIELGLRATFALAAGERVESLGASVDPS